MLHTFSISQHTAKVLDRGLVRIVSFVAASISSPFLLTNERAKMETIRSIHHPSKIGV